MALLRHLQILSSPLPFHRPPQHCFAPSVSLRVQRKFQRLRLAECQGAFSVRAQLADRISVIEEGAPVEEVGDKEDESSKTRVIVQNVPWNSTVDDLRPLFEKFGTVSDIELSMYNKTRNRGLAFVSMGSHEEALACINNLESYEFEGRVLKLNWANPRRIKPVTPPPSPKKLLPVHNLFVSNLPFQARGKDLKEFFNADNGNAVSAEIVFLENPRRSAGYGFVSFKTAAEAEAAVSTFNGKEFMGRQIKVAKSKQFLRDGTKAAIESDTSSAQVESSTPAEESG